MFFATPFYKTLGVAALVGRLRPAALRGCAATPAGQDLSEAFLLYKPPQALGVPVETPLPLHPTTFKARGEVHKDGDWHRSVHIWITDIPGRSLLLQQRSAYKDTHPHKLDVSCAGHITAADDSVDTAVRELEEELGLSFSHAELASAHVCTLPCSASGATAAHGRFQCNEYQDIYLLRVEELPDAEQLDLGSDEVASVTSRSVEAVLAAWDAADAAFVPRGAAYSAVLRAALVSQRFNS